MVAPAEEVVVPASQRFRNLNSQETPDFQRQVVPLLGKLGCNSAKCHGSFQGQGGLRLSLFGFDFESDHAALHGIASSGQGSRIELDDPPNSLIVRKPTDQVPHEGGKRFESGSWEHHLLLRWIEAGAAGVATRRTSVPSDQDYAPEEVAHFTQIVRPILEQRCYECHGFSSRKGGLSLATREKMLIGGASGRVVVPGQPEESLLIAAVRHTDEQIQMPPSGQLAAGDIAALEEWVRMGLPWPDSYQTAPRDTDQVLLHLHYEPDEILFTDHAQTQQLRIVAEWSDGTREDVTCLARFQSNNDDVATVNNNGLATSVAPGDTHVIAFYDNGVAAIPVIRPYRSQGRLPDRSTTHPVDGFVNAKLHKLGLQPSELCTDAEFLRRVSIDMTGTLPTPEQVTTFLDDHSSDKRARKIDELLQRTTYAAWWTNKLCDFTGCNPKSISSLLEVAREDGYRKASEWYDWIYERVERNESYDRLVAGIMLADLSGADNGMPHFWTRQSLVEPKDTAMSVAHAFLGIQLQCAECHKHPFDRWTQSDFNEFARFFDPGATRQLPDAGTVDRELRLLRSQRVHLQADEDPRRPIMDWMRDPQNPWFARVFVNRVWAGYFGRGIVDPPDQFTPANPPSHPELLDWLATGFVENSYDMKWLHRQIATSDAYQRSWRPNPTNRLDRRNFSRSIPRRIPAEVIYDALKQVTAAPSQQAEVRNHLRRRASGHLSMRMAGTHAMRVFGKPERSLNCDCERVNEPTLLQAIFTQNDPLVRMRIADSDWIFEIHDAEGNDAPPDKINLVRQVWLRTVGRYPRDAEVTRAMAHLASADSLADGIAELLWAMINTKEFLLNH